MRNWNKANVTVLPTNNHRLYSTYEELKLDDPIKNRQEADSGLYSTYEELKLDNKNKVRYELGKFI